MSTSPALKLFTNETDYVIAEDVDDAWLQWFEHTGEEREDYEGAWTWEEWPADKMLRIWCSDGGSGPVCEIDEDGGEPVDKTPEQWIASQGRGWLASTEH